MTPQDVLKLCEEKNVEFIDLRFMDFPGLWQHTTLPISELTLDSFDHGFGFDGSSIRGWQAINESDMLVVPEPDTAFLDPFTTLPPTRCRRVLATVAVELGVGGSISARPIPTPRQ